MKKWLTFIVAAVLCLLAIAIFLYKSQILEFPLSANKSYNSWYLESTIKISKSKQDEPINLRLKLPHASKHLAIVDENFIAKKFKKKTYNSDDNQRFVEFKKKKLKKDEVIVYRAIVYELASSMDKTKTTTSAKVGELIVDGIEQQEEKTKLLAAIDTIISAIKDKSKKTDDFVKTLFLSLKENNRDEIKYLIKSSIYKSDVNLLAVDILNSANIPARIVNGINLNKQGKDLKIIRWIEYFDSKWKTFNRLKSKNNINKSYLKWWIGNEPLFELTGKADVKQTLSLAKNTDNSLTRAVWKSGELAGFFLKYSFFNLPLDSQLLFKVLLLIPIGALVITFIRQIIGIQTFGTFMPILIALSFRETGLITGVVLFSVILSIALFLRFYLNRLQLLLVPRLTAVLTIVILLISMLSFLAHNFNFQLGLSMALFPIVILTMTIERMSIAWEESGAKHTLKVAMGSLFAAIVGYLCISHDSVTHMIFTFPELLLIILALSLMLGRYTGYKLTEYFRFNRLNDVLTKKANK